MTTKEELQTLHDAINMRTKKIELHQESIDKLRKLNIRDNKILEKYWEEKYSKYKK